MFRDLELSRSQWLLIAGVMSAMAVTALEASIIGTAMPTVVGQLGGLDAYGWVFSGFLLTSTTTIPIYGRLADTIGRKPVFLFGVTVFVVGSILCGLSTSMVELIGFRAVQGLGAGAIQPMAYTIAGDALNTSQRARVAALFSSVWGISALLGPVVGGLVTQTVGWRWAFFSMIPVGVAAGLVIGRVLNERVERRHRPIDWLGAASLTLGIALLLLYITEGGRLLLGWASPLGLLVASGGVAMLGVFGWVERHSADPIVDPSLLRDPLVATSLMISTLLGFVMWAVTAYVPPLVQGVGGASPLEAGAAVAAMSLGWPVGAVLGGRAFLRFGVRPIVLAGTAAVVVGVAVLAQLANEPSVALAVAGSVITGVGMGFAPTTLMVVIQGAVGHARRGVATSLVQFSRVIGGAVGTGVLGAFLTASIGSRGSVLLDPAGRASMSPAELMTLTSEFANSLASIFVVILAIAGAALAITAVRFPRVRIEGAAVVVSSRRR